MARTPEQIECETDAFYDIVVSSPIGRVNVLNRAMNIIVAIHESEELLSKVEEVVGKDLMYEIRYTACAVSAMRRRHADG